jgi:hypothetical protein
MTEQAPDLIAAFTVRNRWSLRRLGIRGRLVEVRADPLVIMFGGHKGGYYDIAMEDVLRLRAGREHIRYRVKIWHRLGPPITLVWSVRYTLGFADGIYAIAEALEQMGRKDRLERGMSFGDALLFAILGAVLAAAGLYAAFVEMAAAPMEDRLRIGGLLQIPFLFGLWYFWTERPRRVKSLEEFAAQLPWPR